MKKPWVIMLLMILPMLVGCRTQMAWVYKPNTYAPSPPRTAKTAVVLPFDDARRNENSDSLFFWMFPFIPSGGADYYTPECIPMHIYSGLWVNYKPTEDYAKALAQELRKTEVFKEVYFDNRRGNSDYVFQGTILNTKYEGRILSHYVGVFIIYAWPFGVPAMSSKNELSVELMCIDSKTDKVLFTKTYQANPRSDQSSIYNLKSDFHYAEMLAEIYKQFWKDIKPLVCPDIRLPDGPPGK